MLRIAMQAKGRLNEDCMNLLHEIGIDIDGSKRKFLASAANFPVEVLYMRDDDIPQVVASGTASLGIVGLNYRIIALIPVGKKADKIQKYIPICLLM
jgi:ATP phosphoribosyltransferase